MTTIYHNPRCSKSRAALARLEELGHRPKLIFYLDTPLSQEELAALIEQSGLTVAQALRTKEARYTQLALDQDGVTDAERLRAMAQYPELLNRPFVRTEKGVRLARSMAVLEEIL